MTNTRLDTRPGLPDALRILLRDHPRELWSADPGFHGLVSFWLDRHLAFRDITARLLEDAEAVLDARIAPQTHGQRLARLGGHLVQDLHGHHQIEDHHYFPKLAALEPRLQKGFDILDSDHHALDAHLERFVKGANAILQSKGDPVAHVAQSGRFRDELVRFRGFLDRHLIDEEDLIVPVILRHGDRAVG
jgi:iron-sulfur cluster repair protein YtfE (RIC family)